MHLQKIILIVFWVCSSIASTSYFAFSQEVDVKTDRDLIAESGFHDHRFDERVVHLGFSGSRPLQKYNPLRWILGGGMYFYQKVLSQQFFANCMYSPTCSEYSRLLISEYGIFKGIFTSADRLTRCSRISATTIHPLRFSREDGKIHEDVDYYKLKQ